MDAIKSINKWFTSIKNVKYYVICNQLFNVEFKNKNTMSDSGNTVLGFLAGTAIGAVLGILFAPDKGINTRQRLTDEASLAKQKIAETAAELKDKAVTTATAQKQSLDEQVDSMVSSASYKADDIITALESKLKDLKEKNKKLQKNQVS